MIVYVETSALVKLLVREDGSSLAMKLWNAADHLATSRLSYTEAAAALAAAHRNGRISGSSLGNAKQALKYRMSQMEIVEVTEELSIEAGELAERHKLRGYDAIHLAAASLLKGPALVLATWDDDLRRSAKSLRMNVAPA